MISTEKNLLVKLFSIKDEVKTKQKSQPLEGENPMVFS
jgi:hypothetical protein